MFDVGNGEFANARHVDFVQVHAREIAKIVDRILDSHYGVEQGS